MLYHLTTSLSPVHLLGAIMATALFIVLIHIKERKHDPERA